MSKKLATVQDISKNIWGDTALTVVEESTIYEDIRNAVIDGRNKVTYFSDRYAQGKGLTYTIVVDKNNINEVIFKKLSRPHVVDYLASLGYKTTFSSEYQIPDDISVAYDNDKTRVVPAGITISW